MLLETLLWECLGGSSRLADSDLAAVVQSVPESTTIALRLGTPAFRRAANLEGKPLCDGLFVGFVREDDKEPRVYCLFVELKGKKVAHAVEQLANALTTIRAHLQSTLSEMALGRTRFSAVIVSDRAGPSNDVSIADIRRFREEFKSTLYVRYAQRRGDPVDLSPELWRRAT